MMFRSLLGLTVLAAAGPALAAGPGTVPTPQATAEPVAKLDRCLDRKLPTLEAVPACEAAAGLASRFHPSERAALSHRRGEIELRRGRAAEAVVFLEAARQLEPEVASYALTLGDALAASAETARAVAVYREGERLAPSSKVFHARLMALRSSPEALASARLAPAAPIVTIILPKAGPAVLAKPRIESAAPVQAVRSP